MSGHLGERVETSASLAQGDWDHIQQMARFIRGHSTRGALRYILPSSRGESASELLASHTCFDHGAVLVFPDSPERALAELATRGLTARVPVPSVVVRGRLADRYTVLPDELPVMITHVELAEVPDRTLELFMLPCGTPRAASMIDDERRLNNEVHLAFRVLEPDARLLDQIWDSLVEESGFVTDGGGFNPHQGPAGCTVLYFHGNTWLPPHRWPQRVEVIADGHHPEILARHTRDSAGGRRAATT
jgi:hypothetical protein